MWFGIAAVLGVILFLALAACQPSIPTEPEGLTYTELKTFLEEDKTDEISYTPDFLCHHFAMTLLENANKAGIKAGLVSIKFTEPFKFHACNIFPTIDKGDIFIDCSKGHDAEARLEVGKIYYTTYSTNGGTTATAPLGIVEEYRIAWKAEDWADLWKGGKK